MNNINRPGDGVVSDPSGTLLGGNGGRRPAAEDEVETLNPAPRSYRFGHVLVEVYPEIVVIEVPYRAEHDDYCDATMFAQRYTHGTDAFVTEDDEREIQLRIYPNVENLVSGPPFVLPPLDCRVGLWDAPRAIHPGPVVSLPNAQPVHHEQPAPPAMARLLGRPCLAKALATYEQYVEELAMRSVIRSAALLAQSHPVLPHVHF